MGVRYCRPITTVPKSLEPYQRLTLAEIKSKLTTVTKDYQLKGLYFITHEILRDVIHMSEENIYLLEDIYSINRDIRRINSLDFWCSLALSSIGNNEDKITFCFSQMDGNMDGYLSFNELFILITCATRGISRLKGLLTIPLETIDRIITTAFKLNIKSLQHGEISLSDLISYLLTDDLCRSYLSALGAKLPPVDAAAIVLKRANILRELIEIRQKSDEILCEMDEIGSQLQGFQHERGGDSSLLSLQQQTNMNELAKTRYTPTPVTSQIQTLVDKHANFHDIKDSNLLDWNHPVNKYYNTDDIWIYQVYDLRKHHNNNNSNSNHNTWRKLLETSKSLPNLPNDSSIQPNMPNITVPTQQRQLKKGKSFGTILPGTNVYTTAFETELFKEWEKIPHEADQLIPLDAFTLMAIFDRVSITLTYSQAKECLREIPKSQMSKYCFNDVLSWFRYHYESYPIFSINPYYMSWHDMMHTITSSYRLTCNYFHNIGNMLAKQRKIILGVNQDNETFAKKLANIRNISSRKPANISIRYNINGIKPNNPQEEISFNTIPDNSNAWKTKIKIAWTTNPFTNMSTKRSKTNSRIQRFIAEPIAEGDGKETARKGEENKNDTEGKKESEEDQNRPNTSASTRSNDTLEDLFKMSVSQDEEELKKRLEMARKNRPRQRIIKKTNYLYITDYPNLQATDILDYYNLINEEEYEKLIKDPGYIQQKQKESIEHAKRSSFIGSDRTTKASHTGGLQTKAKVYSSVTWFTVELKPQLPYSQIVLVKESIYQFFQFLPIEFHESWFSDIKIEICVIEEQEAEQRDPTRRKSAISLVEMLLRTMSKEKAEADLLAAEEAELERDDYLPKSKVLLISLLHERDFFTELEQYLISSLDIYLSRVVHSASIDLQIMQSLPDLFQLSLSQYGIDQKLYGPEEKELIEKNLVNPLSYAKEIRSIKKSYQDILEGLNEKKYNKDELSVLCKKNGYYAQTTTKEPYQELVERVKLIYELKLELLNYGELNNTSKNILQTIFNKHHYTVEKNKYSREVDDNLKLWEFNDFLYSTNIQTLYNRIEYEKFILSNQLYCDTDKQISITSLYAYYERIGHLYDDLLQWKMVNLDANITGKMNIQLLYDTSALGLLTSSYYDKKPLYVPSFMKELMKLMMIKEYNVDKYVHSISEIIDDLLPLEKIQPPPRPSPHQRTEERTRKDHEEDEEHKKTLNTKQWKDKLLEIFSMPGEFARVISQCIGYWNHGREGVLPLLRKYLYEEFLLDNHLLIKQHLPHYNDDDNNSTADSSTINSPLPLPPEAGNRSPFGSTKSGKPGMVADNTRPTSQKTHRSSVSSQKEEPQATEFDEKTLLDALSFDPLGPTSVNDKKDKEENEDLDSTVYYESEEEEKEDINDIKQRIIFDELFTTVYLKEYQYQLDAALKKEDDKRRFIEEERQAKEEERRLMEEELARKEKERQEKDNPFSSIMTESQKRVLSPSMNNNRLGGKGDKIDEEELSIVEKLLNAEEMSSMITVLTDEEVQENLTHELAHAFLTLQPNLLRQKENNNNNNDGENDTNNNNNTNNKGEEHYSNQSTFQSSIPNRYWKKLKDQVIADLIFLYQVRNIPNINLTLEESNDIEQRKIYLFKLLQEISTLQYQHYQNWTKSMIMMYDCLRLFTTDIGHIGIGTKDVCIRFYMNNLYTKNQSNQLLSLLPKGLNELSPIQEYEKQKLQRYINRKIKALAAIERERLRRNMTEEDKEKLRYEKLLQQKQQFYEEEKQLYHIALEQLFTIRENNIKNKDEINDMVKLFEDIVNLKENRFPNDFHTQIAKNNYSCLLYEYYGLEHPLGEPAQYLLQEASEQIVNLGYDDIREGNQDTNLGMADHPGGGHSNLSIHTETTSIPSTIVNAVNTPLPNHRHQNPPNTTTAAALSTPNQLKHASDDSSTIFTTDDHSQLHHSPSQGSNHSHSPNPLQANRILYPLNKAIILINYLYTLQKTESFTTFKQSTNIKTFLIKCYQQLSNHDKHKLRNGIISDIDTISVFRLQDLIIPKKQINHIISILETCQKEYDYLERQRAMLSGGSLTSGKLQGSLSYSLDSGTVLEEGENADDAMSDIQSVVSQSKKTRSKSSSRRKKKRKGTASKSSKSGVSSVVSKGSTTISGKASEGEDDATNEGDEENDDDDDDASSSMVLDESQKRRKLQDLKKQKYLEQRKKDQLLRQEISRQRNKLYTLIQTNQISEIFDRKASKANQIDAPKWGGSVKTATTTSGGGGSEMNEDDDNEEAEEQAENEFLELAKGVANHSVK